MVPVSGLSAIEQAHVPQRDMVGSVCVEQGRVDVLGATEAGERRPDVADPGAFSVPRGGYTAAPCSLANAGEIGITQHAGCAVTSIFPSHGNGVRSVWRDVQVGVPSRQELRCHNDRPALQDTEVSTAESCALMCAAARHPGARGARKARR